MKFSKFIGDSGAGIQEWVNNALGVKQLTFPHLRILYPTAPARYIYLKLNLFVVFVFLCPSGDDVMNGLKGQGHTSTLNIRLKVLE